MKGLKLFAGFAAMSAAVSPAAAAGPFDTGAATEQHRAAFGGVVLRLGLDGRDRRAPEPRLAFGFTRYERDMGGAFVARGATLPLEAGFAGGRPQLFVGGESLQQFERRLGVSGSSGTTLLAIGGLAAGAAAVVLLTRDDDPASPCPPGVEVCAF